MKRPLNIPFLLDDGRKLLIRYGQGKTMVCRQKAPGRALRVGDRVSGREDKEGQKIALEVVKRTKKDVTFKILGSYYAKRELDWQGQDLGFEIKSAQGSGDPTDR